MARRVEARGPTSARLVHRFRSQVVHVTRGGSPWTPRDRSPVQKVFEDVVLKRDAFRSVGVVAEHSSDIWHRQASFPLSARSSEPASRDDSSDPGGASCKTLFSYFGEELLELAKCWREHFSHSRCCPYPKRCQETSHLETLLGSSQQTALHTCFLQDLLNDKHFGNVARYS